MLICIVPARFASVYGWAVVEPCVFVGVALVVNADAYKKRRGEYKRQNIAKENNLPTTNHNGSHERRHDVEKVKT